MTNHICRTHINGQYNVTGKGGEGINDLDEISKEIW